MAANVGIWRENGPERFASFSRLGRGVHFCLEGCDAMIRPIRTSVDRSLDGYDEIRQSIGKKLSDITAADGIAAAAASLAEALTRSGLGDVRLVLTVRGDTLEVEVRPVRSPARTADAPPAGSFAAWLIAHLKERNLSHEAAARLVGVSVKTVGRWARSETEPRMRDLRRLNDVFGEAPPLEVIGPAVD